MRFFHLVIATLISSGLHAQQPRTFLMRVSEVLDGNTFKATYTNKDGQTRNETFRLFGIAPPIKDEAKGIEQPYWGHSRHKLGAIVGETVKAISQDFDGDEYWDIYDGVTFHKLHFAVPEYDTQLRKAFGGTMEVVVGVGPQAVYFGVGKTHSGQ